jgi:hypothetical protein
MASKKAGKEILEGFFLAVFANIQMQYTESNINNLLHQAGNSHVRV